MTDYMTANTINDLFRSLFALLDKAAYMLLGWMYEILFNVASADIFANDTVHNFYGRIQMIIGVFMVFRLAVSIIQGIINPDTFTDKKSGFSNIIGRVIFALIMLAIMTPINIPGATSSYEINLNNNGLLFGTLYELQDRILANNTLGRLILGTSDGYSLSSKNSTSNQALSQSEKVKKASNLFTSEILKGFVRINLVDSSGDEDDQNNWVCGNNIDQNVLKAYGYGSDPDADPPSPNEILSLVNVSCTSSSSGGFFATLKKAVKRLFSGDRYAFAYLPIISTIVAAIFIYILLGEIITIAIRSVKLAVLRLLAPIPIISYIDPKSEKDGAFGSWVKSLTSTYLELFIHLAVIYFILFLINDMITNSLVMDTGTGIIGVISTIFIWIGLFFFVKQAPKFIKDILGVKGSSANVGLAGLLGGTAMALEGRHRSFGDRMRSFAFGAMTGTDAATQGYNQGKAVPLGSIWSGNQNKMAQMLTFDKDAQGGWKGHMMDQLNYDIRESQARRLGMGVNDLADAKYVSDVRQAQAGAAKRELDFAEMALRNLGPNATAEERASAQARYEEAYAKNERYQSEFGRADSAYKKMDTDRANSGLGPRISDKRGEYPTYRSPHETVGTAETNVDHIRDLPDTPQSQADILGTVTEHRNDLKNFQGTADDSGVGSMGHGAGGGPGGGPRP